MFGQSSVKTSLFIADVGRHTTFPVNLCPRVNITGFLLGAIDGVTQRVRKLGQPEYPEAIPP